MAALMFLDYYLTLKGYKLAKENYLKHFIIESYELNPRFKKSITENRYNFKHLVYLIY